MIDASMVFTATDVSYQTRGNEKRTLKLATEAFLTRWRRVQEITKARKLRVITIMVRNRRSLDYLSFKPASHFYQTL